MLKEETRTKVVLVSFGFSENKPISILRENQ